MRSRAGWKLVNFFHLCSQGWLCPFTRCSIIGSGLDLAIPIQYLIYRTTTLMHELSFSEMEAKVEEPIPL